MSQISTIMEVRKEESKSMWSFLDNFSPELFTFGFDPEILTAFWGLLRSGGGAQVPSAPRFIPAAKYQLLVPFQSEGGNGMLPFVQCAFATGSVVFLVTLSSYAFYKALLSSRRRTSDSPSMKIGSSFDENDSRSKEGVESPARIERPTTLNVGRRSVRPPSSKFDLLRMVRSRSTVDSRDFDLDDVEDIGDIQGEYFGPASLEDLTDETSAGSSDFQTPCA